MCTNINKSLNDVPMMIWGAWLLVVSPPSERVCLLRLFVLHGNWVRELSQSVSAVARGKSCVAMVVAGHPVVGREGGKGEREEEPGHGRESGIDK